MDQQGQMFMPDTLLARTGQPVHFRSSEDVLHNVRVIRNDQKPIFNVATPPWGSYTHTFDEPGFYNVTCDIHAAMRATMYVASTPYVGTADERGHFTFEQRWCLAPTRLRALPTPSPSRRPSRSPPRALTSPFASRSPLAFAPRASARQALGFRHECLRRNFCLQVCEFDAPNKSLRF